MRQGSYLLTGSTASEVVERFTCGPDGDGWTYAAVREDPGTGAPLGRLQLRLDATGATSRLHVETGAWVVRGGCVGGSVLWRRGEQEGEAVALGFTGADPAYDVAVALRLRLAVGERRRVRLVEVTEPVLATRLVDREWSRPAVDRWAVVDLATGERHEVDPDTVVAGMSALGWSG